MFNRYFSLINTRKSYVVSSLFQSKSIVAIDEVEVNTDLNIKLVQPNVKTPIEYCYVNQNSRIEDIKHVFDFSVDKFINRIYFNF